MIQIDMDMPMNCKSCFAYRYEWGDEYRQGGDSCSLLKRYFNRNGLEINPYEQRLNDCPLKGA